MSDPLYEHDRHLNLTRKKDQGILQFGKIRHKRGDDEKRMEKLKEFARPEDDMVSDMRNLGLIINDRSMNENNSTGKLKKGEK